MSSSQRNILSFFTTEANKGGSTASPPGSDSLNDNSNGSEVGSEVDTLETAACQQYNYATEYVTEEPSLLGSSSPVSIDTCTSSVATQIMIDKFHPPSTFKFPKRKFGTSERSFHSHWCDEYNWLHYNTLHDAAFCYLCMKAEKESKLLTSTRREPFQLERGS